MCQNANIIVYIWSPNLAMCAVIKIGVCTQPMSDFSQSEFLSHFLTGRNVFFVIRSRTTLKFWSATTFGAVARNFGPVHKFELPTVIADSVPRATRVFSLASVGHVTGHMVSHMVPMARCRPPYWKIFTVNNLAGIAQLKKCMCPRGTPPKFLCAFMRFYVPF